MVKIRMARTARCCAHVRGFKAVRVCRPQVIHQIAREGGFTAIKIGCTQYISKKELIVYAASPEKVSNPTSETYKTLIKTFKAKRSREIENEKRREKRRCARIEKGH